MQLEQIEIDKLIPYARNSRKHSDEQIMQVAASIKEFGFLNPVIVDKDNGIVAGHCRVLAAHKLSIDTIPCVRADHLTESQKRAYVIVDNNLALNSEWDEAMLSLEIGDLKDADFDLDLIGFDDDYLNELLSLDESSEGLVDDDSIPDLSNNVIAKLGDVWLLGRHRLMCGDSTDCDGVVKLLDGQEPNTMITDPPYGVSYKAGNRAGALNRKKTAREMQNDLLNDDRSDWFDAYNHFNGGVAYVWHASKYADVVMDGLRRAGFEITQQIIWNKNVHALGRSDYHWKHEPCWYAVKGGANRNWKGGRTQMTVWDIKSIIFEKDKTSHPTQKPVEIYTRPLEHHTSPGEYVYEPFGGSGSAIIACEKLGRRSLTMELDPKFCDVIIKRWQEFTGNKAVNEETGQNYPG